MIKIQKIIKYLAIALAIYLIVTIILAIVNSIYGIVSSIRIKKNNVGEMQNVSNYINVDLENTSSK